MNRNIVCLLILLWGIASLDARLPEYDAALKQYQSGKYAESLDTIRSVFDNNRNSMELRMLAAANYIQQGNFGSAQDHLRFCIQDHPNAHQPRLFLAAMYRKTGKHQAALNVAVQALKQTGDSVPARLEIAASYLAMNNTASARAHLARALVLAPQDFNVIFMDGLVYLQEGNLDNAEFRFRNALQLPIPGKKALADLYLNLGMILEKKADQLKASNQAKDAVIKYADSMNYYNKAKKADPSSQKIKDQIQALDKKLDE